MKNIILAMALGVMAAISIGILADFGFIGGMKVIAVVGGIFAYYYFGAKLSIKEQEAKAERLKEAGRV